MSFECFLWCKRRPPLINNAFTPKKEKKKTILASFWKSKATKETKSHCVFTKLNSPVIVAEWVIFWRQKSRIKRQFHSNFIAICFWNNWSRHLMCLSQCVIGYCSSLKSFHQRRRRWWREGSGFRVGGKTLLIAHGNQTTFYNWRSKRFPINLKWFWVDLEILIYEYLRKALQ